MKVEILGTGCARCNQLYENAKTAIAQLDSSVGIDVIKVSDVNYFTKMGVFMTPGLLIDGEVIAVGKVLTAEQVKKRIEEKL
jgi:small redox-active disulfide protein 2